ncbi:STAS domain-containing protein [Streptomyces sp. NPDC087844]|uniref:STAS domain-containing protein n=1 Tax=Streptomyces sp. NPDC087844 TaxID=3365805 RepID=UPI0037F1FEC8
MAGPSVEVVPSGCCLVARVGGEMNQSTHFVLRERFSQLTVAGNRFIVLDPVTVSFCDSAGLNIRLTSGRQAETLGAILALAAVPPQLQEILQRTGADQVLPVYDTVIDAQAALCR